MYLYIYAPCMYLYIYMHHAFAHASYHIIPYHVRLFIYNISLVGGWYLYQYYFITNNMMLYLFIIYLFMYV